MAVDPYRFGKTFEEHVCVLLCRNSKFYGLVGDALDADAFDLPEARLIVRASQAVARDLGRGPTSDTIVVQRLRRWSDDGRVPFQDVVDVVDLMDRVDDNGGPADYREVVCELVPVLKDRMRAKAASTAFDERASGGDFSKVVRLIDQANSLGHVDTGTGVQLGTQSFDVIQAQRGLDRMPTGVDDLDIRLNGGVPRGELTVFVAETGGGKSVFLSQIAAVGLGAGMFVGYATLELPEGLVLARVKAALTSVPIDDIVAGPPDDSTARERLQSMVDQGLGLCVVKFFTGGVTTPNDLFDWVERCEREANRKLDCLIVDYGDKLVDPSTDSKYEQGEKVFEGLRVMAAERDWWVWTASQAKRRKRTDKRYNLDTEDIADSLHKARVADKVITINLADNDDGSQDPEISLFVAKNRTGRGGFAVGPFPAEFWMGRLCASSVLGGQADDDFYEGIE